MSIISAKTFSVLISVAIAAASAVSAEQEMPESTVQKSDSMKVSALTDSTVLDSASQKDTASTAEIIDSASSVSIAAADTNTKKDTAATAPVDTSAKNLTADTAKTEADLKQTLQAAPKDTSYRFYDRPFLSVGIGWSLGSMPVFDEWSEDLPDLLTMMPGYDSTIKASYEDLIYPDAYNTSFPITISITPLVTQKGHLTVIAGGTFMSKDFTGSWLNNSMGTIWRVTRGLSVVTGSAGLKYYHRIPSSYFSIANVDRAFAVVGLLAAPYVKITDSYTSFSGLSGAGSSYEKHHKGYNFSWQAGISTFKLLSERSGAEIGLMYTGQWFCRFMKNEHHEKWSDISSVSEIKNETLEFMTHRLLISFNLMAGRKQNAVSLKK